MIQRIQTLFLVVAFGLIISLFFIDIAHFNNGIVYNLSGFSSSIPRDYNTINQLIWLQGGAIFSIILLVVIIFLFKNRKLQMKLSLFGIVILLLLNGLIYYILTISESSLNALVDFKSPILFPIVASVLVFLAYWNIRKDDNLIKSLDRLR